MSDIYGRVSVECCSCGIAWAMSAEHDATLRRTHQLFYCPNGHGQSYNGKSEAEKLREQRDAKQRELDAMTRSRDSYRADFDRADAQYRCPIAGCDETRMQKAAMRRHMEREHGYAEKPPKALPANAGPSAKNSVVS